MATKNPYFIRAKLYDGTELETETANLKRAFEAMGSFADNLDCVCVELWHMNEDEQSGRCIAAYNPAYSHVNETGNFSYQPGW